MYRIPIYQTTLIKANRLKEGETIENKVKRLMANKEPIKDGSPLIYTERKDGVQPAYNIRTDRFEIAADSMDKVHRSKEAKRDELIKGESKEAKIVDMKESKEGKESRDGKPDSAAGEADKNKSVK